jgi:uncharacterized membrane protein YphA (DoxX/SURF4 family)
VEKLLGDYAPQVYALLRIVVGFLFFCHGLQKFLASSAASTARVQLLRSFSLFGVARCRQVTARAEILAWLLTVPALCYCRPAVKSVRS